MADYIQIGVSMTTRQAERIQALADKQGTSISETIRNLLNIALPFAEGGHGLDFARLLTILEFSSLALDTLVQRAPKVLRGMPHPPIVFKNVYDFYDMRQYPYVQKNWQRVSFKAEGLIDGKVVVTETKMPSRRSTQIRLRIDNEGQQLTADGSDFVCVIAEVTDDQGNVRRLAKEQILFSVEGEGEIIGDASIQANPRVVEFGSAPVLIRSTTKAGKIKVIARPLFEGEYAPKAATLEFMSVTPSRSLLFEEKPALHTVNQNDNVSIHKTLSDEEKQKLLNEVERQQTDFGEVRAN